MNLREITSKPFSHEKAALALLKALYAALALLKALYAALALLKALYAASAERAMVCQGKEHTPASKSTTTSRTPVIATIPAV
jgi:hypothetical protein